MGRAEAASHPVRFDATDVMVLYRPGVRQADRLGMNGAPAPEGWRSERSAAPCVWRIDRVTDSAGHRSAKVGQALC